MSGEDTMQKCKQCNEPAKCEWCDNVLGDVRDNKTRLFDVDGTHVCSECIEEMVA